MKIALMCPTRNRKNKLLTLIASLITTIKNKKNVCLVLGVDEDDPIINFYSYLQNNLSFVEVIKFKNNGKFLGLSTMWNEMAKQTNADVYAMIGDDMAFITQDWDVEILKEFENGPKDNVLMVHCNDGMRGMGNKYEKVKPFCVNFFIHRKSIDAIGYFVEPYIENIHQDTWIQVVYDTLNRSKYRHDILIKHLHVSETKDKIDNVTDNLEKLRVGIWDNSDWMKTYKNQLESDIKKLQNIMR
jgi:hypothetical protein